jgi:hypothetical protein
MRPAGEHEGSSVTDERQGAADVLDYVAVGRQVKADADALFESADEVYVELLDLASDQDWEPAASIMENEREIPRSADELTAQLNGIAAVAFRLARSVHPLMESRTTHLAARADSEAGRQAPTSAPKS